MKENEFKKLKKGDVVIFTCKNSLDYGRKFKFKYFLKYTDSGWKKISRKEFVKERGWAYFEPLDGKKIHVSYEMKLSRRYEEINGIGRRLDYMWTEWAD